MSADQGRRILIVDDQEDIHSDFNKVLAPRREAQVDELDALGRLLLEGEEAEAPAADADPLRGTYRLAHAMQGRTAYEMVQEALREEDPFALIFLDLRMPPGWDGMETMRRIWEVDPQVQIVLCTAYSDYSWEELLRHVPNVDQFVVLKKPFDSVEVRQLALAMSERWSRQRKLVAEGGALSSDITRRVTELLDSTGRLDGEPEQLEARAEAFLRVAQEELGLLLGRQQHFIDDCRRQATGLWERVAGLQGLRRGIQATHRALDQLVERGQQLRRQAQDQVQEVHLPSLLQDVVSLMQVAAQHRGVELQLGNRGAFPETLRADPTVLRQVVLNLINAALRFVQGGRVTCLVEMQGAAADVPERLRIRVGNHALELADEDFEGMLQSWGADSDYSLAVTQAMVEGLGAELLVHKAPGQGTEFEVRLPLGGAPGRMVEGLELPGRADEGGELACADAPDASVPQLRGRVLVAEDCLDHQRLATFILERAGLDVVVVENGEQCCRVALDPKQGIDLVLMDIQMPVMDGLQAAAHLRRTGFDRPIIAVTASSQLEANELHKEPDLSAFLPKPLSCKSLLEMVCAHLGAPAAC